MINAIILILVFIILYLLYIEKNIRKLAKYHNINVEYIDHLRKKDKIQQQAIDFNMKSAEIFLDHVINSGSMEEVIKIQEALEIFNKKYEKS